MSERVGVLFRNPEKLRPYERALREAGLDPVRLPPDDPRPLDGLAGLLFTGGGDVNPSRYGAAPAPETYGVDEPRDEAESRRMREAIERDIPFFCICRGMQLFNVVCGGTLIQHLDGHRIQRENPGQPVHSVEILPDTRLREILGTERHEVNSRHHQAVDRVGDWLMVSACADDVIEAIELPGRRFALGVQWHPEDSIDNPLDRRLFDAFSNAVKSR